MILPRHTAVYRDGTGPRLPGQASWEWFDGSTVTAPGRLVGGNGAARALAEGDSLVLSLGDAEATATSTGPGTYEIDLSSLVDAGEHAGDLQLVFASGQREVVLLVRALVRSRVADLDAAITPTPEKVPL